MLPFTLGGDPEFEVRDASGKVIPAFNLFEGKQATFGEAGKGILEYRTPDGQDDKNEYNMNYKKYLHTRIGVDGDVNKLELRPLPAESAKDFARNFKSLVVEFHAKYPGLQLHVVSDKVSLGGHLHFGMYKPMTPSASVLRMLDDILGKRVLPLSGKFREQSKYYKLSAYETKSWGFEYRTPPAAIFYSPDTLMEASMNFFEGLNTLHIIMGMSKEEFMALDKTPELTPEKYDSYVVKENIISFSDFYKRSTDYKLSIEFWKAMEVHGCKGDIIPNWLEEV